MCRFARAFLVVLGAPALRLGVLAMPSGASAQSLSEKVNLETAKSLGRVIPSPMLLRATVLE